ncbi:MAG: hypothetical protein QMD53_03015 [Actinomycetota bacterium]|nr:hypothetical protein [Actinomycetota bacterium]
MKKRLMATFGLIAVLLLASCAKPAGAKYNHQGNSTERPVFIMFTSPT